MISRQTHIPFFAEDSTKNDIYREATKALESSDDEEEEGPALQASKNDHNYATRDEEDDEVDNASTATTDTNKLKKDEDDNEEEISEILTKLKNVLDFKQTVDTVYPYGYTSHTIDLATIANRILSGQARRIICMCGAGISVSAGIPDFRSPGTGLYSRLQEYKLPHPEAVFEIGFFKRNPKPFYLLAKELYPGNYAPTPTHHFMHLLHQKGVLLRCYTQNIDSLENLAGLPKESVIAAHGNFDGAHCVECRAEHDVEYVKSSVYKQTPCYCVKGRKGCKGLVKPAIVFFGESLPEKFWKMVPQDFPQADLLIVMGTSLVVQPFASLISR